MSCDDKAYREKHDRLCAVLTRGEGELVRLGKGRSGECWDEKVEIRSREVQEMGETEGKVKVMKRQGETG